MRKTTIRRPLTAFVAVAALLVTGCILSGQFIIVIAFDGNIAATHSLVGSADIDLTDNSTWEKHSDDLQSIVDLKFECKVINNDGLNAAHGEVWISPTTVGDSPDAATVRGHGDAILFLTGFEIAAGAERSIDFKQSAEFITNLEAVLEIVEEGKFYVYGIAEEDTFDITITGIGDGQPYGRIMVTFSAG